MAPGIIEPQVRIFSRMPKDYRFVPKGDVYITANVRKRTHDAGSTLYVVIDKNKKPLGLRCPVAVYEAVVADSLTTAEARAAAVQIRDTATERTFEEAMLNLFPELPKAEAPKILKRTLKKRSRRVGRTGTIDLEEKVDLAVRAHIRHNHTAYDQMLKDGMGRRSARSKVQKTIDKTALRWGWRKPKIVTTKEGNKATSRNPKARNATVGGPERAGALGTETGRSSFRSTNKKSVELVDADADSEEFGDEDDSSSSDSDDHHEEEDEEEGDEDDDDDDDDDDEEDDSFIVEDDDEDGEDDSFVLQDDPDDSD